MNLNVPLWRGTTGGGAKRERGLFGKLKAKAAKVNIAIHPLIPPPAGDKSVSLLRVRF
jgi:hypothetical protein